MTNYSIGVDLGGTNLRIATIDEHGNVLEKVTLGVRVTQGRDLVVEDMCGAIQAAIAKFQAIGPLQGIGIGVPGIIDMAKGTVHESPNLPGWDNYPVRDKIEKRLGTPVILENDANSAALGEMWLGASRGVEDMAIITLGTGVGGGMVLRGRVWHGATGMAGEFGHMTVEPDGALCLCGNRGCLEAYSSATAILRMAREAVASGAATRLREASANAEFSARMVYNLAMQGDEEARKVFDRVGRALGILLAGVINALNLPMYVIGGGVSAAWDLFSPAVFQELRERSMVYAATAPEAKPGRGVSAHVMPGGTTKTIITPAVLGSDAGLFGAARLPFLDRRSDQRTAVRSMTFRKALRKV